MRVFVGVTDYDWFKVHASKTRIEEVNFWRPSPDATFKALSPGEPFLFKLHSPRNFIVGGGFFSKFLQLPVSLAWEAFGDGNGAYSLSEVRQRISQYRRVKIGPQDDPRIGCIILLEPFFFVESQWIPCPRDFGRNIVSGKGYITETIQGQELWQAVGTRLETQLPAIATPGPATLAAVETSRYGKPVLVEPRLGQGAFRLLVTDAYSRRCAMTLERTLPVLEAAHIRPYGSGGPHELANGILLRSDLHKLFDQGYLSIDPNEKRIMVSPRIKQEFENGRDYYELHGRLISSPSDPRALPAKENLLYHSQKVFR